MTKRILIAGYYGFNNVGDEAILAATLTNLRSFRSDLEFCVISGNPCYTMNTQNVSSIFWKDISSIYNEMEKCDLVILGGGGIFHDYWGVNQDTLLTKDHAGITFYSGIPLLANLLKKPIVIYSVGVGPIISAEGKRLTSMAFELGQVTSVRDNDSKELLLDYGCKAVNIKVYADPAFTLRSDSIKTSEILSDEIRDDGKPLVAVCLRNWEIDCDPEHWQKEVAAGLDHLVESYLCNLLFIPFQTLPEYSLTDDYNVARIVISHMKNTNSAIVLNGIYPPEVISSIIGRCQFVVGMRLHSLIFAANEGIPMMGIIYDPKVKQLMNKLGLDNLAVDLNLLSKESFNPIVEKIWNDRNGISKTLKKKTRRLKWLAKQNAKAAIQLLEKETNEIIETQPISEVTKRLVLTQFKALIVGEQERKFLHQNLSEIENKVTLLEFQHQQNSAAINTLNDQLSYLEICKSALDIQLSASKDQVSILENRLKGKDKRIINLTKKQNAIKLVLKERDGWLEEKDRIIQNLTKQLINITRSRGWKFLQLIWNIRLWFFPHGSTQENFLKRTIHVVSNIRSFEGRTNPPGLFREVYTEIDNSKVTLYTNEKNFLPEYANRKGLDGPIETPRKLKISLISCVKNEISSCLTWLAEITKQTLQPDEIIIVDTGSIDGTLELLRKAEKDFPIRIVVISKPGINISQGRNLAIKQARNTVIASTDFGAIPKSDWLEKITYPFFEDPGVNVAAGMMKPISQAGRKGSNTLFWMWSHPENIWPQNYLPPGASIAFKKDCWESVGGFPEWLTLTGEDTYFDLELKKYGGKWAYVPDAIIYWHCPENLVDAVRKLFYWAVGDGESGVHANYYWRYAIRVSAAVLIILLTLVATLIVICISHPPFLIWSILVLGIYLAIWIVLSRKMGFSLVQVVQKILAEIAQVSGFIKGAKRRKQVDQRRFALVKGVFLILAGVPIDDTGGGSRGSQIARELVHQGFAVIYINKYPKYESKELNIQFTHPNLFLFSLSVFNWNKFLLENQELIAGKKINCIIEFPHADFLPIIHGFKVQMGTIIYDLLDDWQTSLGSQWFSEEIEKEIIRISDCLVATSPRLLNRLANISGREVTLVPNAVNTHIFNPKFEYPRPVDLPPGDRVFTYVGALWGDWFDWELLNKIADHYQESVICLIGDFHSQHKALRKNIHFLGLKPQTDLPAYLYHSDVGIIPWKDNKITQATSPLKLYEYLAMRLPVVAPFLKVLENIPGVFLAKNKDEFVSLIENAQKLQLNSESIAPFADDNNWQTRVIQLLSLTNRNRINN